MDIRGRCDPVYDKKNFRYCPARVDTILFHFQNDYNSYKILEKDSTIYKLIIQSFCKKYKMSEIDIEKVIDLYEEENLDNDNET